MKCMSGCGNKSYYYCAACSVDKTKPIACCGIRTGRDCFAKHVKTMYSDEMNNKAHVTRTPVVNTPARRRRQSPRRSNT